MIFINWWLCLFVAGADIKEMQPMTFPGVYKDNFLCHWAEFSKARTPIIAAVNGYAVSVRKKIISSKNVFFFLHFYRPQQ